MSSVREKETLITPRSSAARAESERVPRPEKPGYL